MIDVAGLLRTVFSGLSALVIEDVEDAGDLIVVRARTRDEPAPCPDCGTQTARVHGYYDRPAADVPVDAGRVIAKRQALRPRCPALGCRRRPRRQQVPAVPARHQRAPSRPPGPGRATVPER